MASELGYTPLGQLCDPERGITYGIVKVGDFVPGGVPVIRGGDIRNGLVVFDDEKRVTQEISQQFQRTILKGGEIVINLIAEPGHTAIVPPELADANVSRDVGVIPLNDTVDHRYIDYCLKSPMAVQWLTSRLQGSVTQKINLGTLRDLPIPTPRLEEQRAIAHILGTLDDKIELNRRMNETLEAMARALFKSWFADFDPVRAKAEGRQPACMDVETAALFPDAFEDSTLGKRPKGWYVGPLGGILELKRGYDLPQQRRIFGFIPIYSSSGLTGYHSEAKVKGPGIVTGRYGTIGEIFFVNEDFWPLNTTLYVRNFKNNIPRFVYYLLHTLSFEAYLDKAAVPGINRNHVHQEIVLCPPVNLQCKFVELLEPFWQRQAMNNKEARTLTTLRDTLLPKLISGGLRVKDAERFIGRAG
jgi:type I restriction enzyme S subunit